MKAGRAARAGFAALALAVLAGCSTVPSDGEGSQADAGTGAQPALKPLARQPGTPADQPRSRVPAARYDLDLGRPDGEGLPPDDGVPGDEPSGEVFQRGGASWYGIQFHQRKTANGERFDMGAMTAAHKTLPFNTRLCVRSLVNGKEVLVRVNDRGPYAAGRIIDLSMAAAEVIDMIGLGIKQVTLTIIGKEGGRCAGAPVRGTGSADDDAERDSDAVKAKATSPAKKPAARRKVVRKRR